jgi:GT2 family glycosyltransferase
VTGTPVAVVIPNYNGWRDTVECVRSLLAVSGGAPRVVVVDNASADDSVERLREAFANEASVEIVPLARNLGYAGALNAGVEHVRADAPDFVWFLNNDTVVDDGALSAQLEAARVFPRAAVFAPKIVYFDEPDVIWSAGSVIIRPRGRCEHRGYDAKDDGAWDRAEAVDSATGCSLLARWDAVEAAGGWSEDYFMYWEDVDWVDRVKAQGRTCVYVPAARVLHKVGRSFEGAKPLQVRYEARSRLMFFWRRHRMWFPLVLAWTKFDALNNWRVFGWWKGKATYLGIFDFLAGRRGALPGERVPDECPCETTPD